MLVLSRLKNEKVRLDVSGVTIVVTVVRVRGGIVRLGFEAPENVGVLRQEVYDRIAKPGVPFEHRGVQYDGSGAPLAG